MMTTPTLAAYLEVDETFVEQGEVYVVKSIQDVKDDDYIDLLVTEDNTGDEYPMTFAPFDTVLLVTSFEDEGE